MNAARRGVQDILLALARFEPRIGLADHEYLAAPPHDLAVTVTGFRRFEGGEDFHDKKPYIEKISAPV